MKNLFRLTSMLMVAVMVATGCKKDDDGPDTPSLNPEVTGFSPTEVVAGTTVTITGKDFPSDASTIEVTFFDGVVATIVSNTSTEIVVTVPEGAQNGPVTVSFDGEDITTTTEADVRLDIPRDGLVAFYSFTGDASDESDNSNDGTVSGATLTADRYGNANSAFSFDGTDDYIEVADDATLDLTSAATISMWINVNSITNASLFDKTFISGESAQGYRINLDFISQRLNFGFDNNLHSSPSNSLEVNKWEHVVVTFDGLNIDYYLNGALVSTSAINNQGDMTPNDMALLIGKNSNDNLFDGAIDDVAIYNTALNADQIAALHNQTITE